MAMTPTPHSGSCFLSPLNDLQDAQVAVKVVQGTLDPPLAHPHLASLQNTSLCKH